MRLVPAVAAAVSLIACSALAQSGAESAGRATPASPGAAAAATPQLVALAQAEAQGAQPEGQVFAGQFTAGQRLEQPINLQAGKCYTVVAAGIGVLHLEVKLVVKSAFGPELVLAKSATADPTAVVGGKAEGCLKNPAPIGGPAVVVVTAVRGAGLAAAQLLVK